MLACVHGNIGSGKTTFISNNFDKYVKIFEPLEDWDLYFNKYYKAISKNGNLSLSE